ncbi:MAG: hypothetical protein PVH80_06100 [Anaerolineae bacterium]|jgi:hypothetical protein
MRSPSRPAIALTCLALALSACFTTPTPPSEQQVVDIVWQALRPNTSSRDQAAWEVVSMETVTGRDVQDLFEEEPVPGRCAPGPTPPANARIVPGGSYWYVQMKPRPATPRPQPTELFSPTAAPIVPEPYVYHAHFLVDAGTGQVVARKLNCVIY